MNERIRSLVITRPLGTDLIKASTSEGAGMTIVPLPQRNSAFPRRGTTFGKSLLSASFSRQVFFLRIHFDLSERPVKKDARLVFRFDQLGRIARNVEEEKVAFTAAGQKFHNESGMFAMHHKGAIAFFAALFRQEKLG